MTATVSVRGGAQFTCRAGQVLLDAALEAGVDVPHDCRSGVCGTCRVNVDGREVLACQTTVHGDVTLALDDRPPVVTVDGVVTGLSKLAADVYGVSIRTDRPFDHLPGQYGQFTFHGFPTRCFSPTLPLTRPPTGEVHLHVQVVPDGRVSASLGSSIRPGHRVRLRGPFGSAYLRPGVGRLVLVASGTGFAPVWSIAHAALRDRPDRAIVVVASARSREQLYMGPALLRLSVFPRVDVYAGVRSPDPFGGLFFVGDPLGMVPPLRQDDVVYGCGSPQMVYALAEMADTAGAECHADAFTPPPPEKQTILGMVRRNVSTFLGYHKSNSV